MVDHTHHRHPNPFATAKNCSGLLFSFSKQFPFAIVVVVVLAVVVIDVVIIVDVVNVVIVVNVVVVVVFIILWSLISIFFSAGFFRIYLEYSFMVRRPQSELSLYLSFGA